MKHAVVLAALAGIGLSCQSHADPTATGNIHIQGDVNNFCYLGNTPVMAGIGNKTIVGEHDARMVFEDFVQSDGKHASRNFTVTFPQAICNYRAKLGLRSSNTGLKPAGTPAIIPGFTSIVHYSATATWGSGGPSTQVVTSTGPAGNNNAMEIGPITGDLLVSITTVGSTLPLLSEGTPFTDVLVVQIGQQL